MLKGMLNIFKVEHLREKIMFTLLALIVFRIGTFVPVPGADRHALQMQDNSGAIGLLDTFGGGALGNFSIFAMGVMPYITAMIVMQLLQMDVVPKFSEWRREGETGQKKILQVTRYSTAVLAFVQGIGLSIGFNSMFPGLITDTSLTNYLFIATVLTAGTMFLMWLGEQITEHGIGNGISIIIFGGIISAIPTGLNQLYALYIVNAGEELFMNLVMIALLLLAIVFLIVGVIFIQQAIRKIPVQYANKTVNGQSQSFKSNYLPMKLNPAGVIPIIFAVSLFIFPSTIVQLTGSTNSFLMWVSRTFDLGNLNPTGMIIYSLLIIGFTYFYTFIQVDPEKMADNLQKQGGYIPGIRPGQKTKLFISKVLYRLVFVGALFLATISLIPMFFTSLLGLPPSVQVGGAGLLIVVSVALQTMQQIESQTVSRKYTGFLKKSS